MHLSPISKLGYLSFKPTLKQRSLQRASAKATSLFSIFFHILCAVSSGVEIWTPLLTAPATL